MSKITKILMLIVVCIVTITLAISIGSVSIKPLDTVNIILNKLFSIQLFGDINETTEAILWKIRVPRAILAFVCGSGLSVSGVIMQSVLGNPLASSFTLGVSSGSALGASIVIIFSISIFGFLTLPIFGLVFGMITVILALTVAIKIDNNLQNNSIILTGMAFSLFANAIITIIMSISTEQFQRLIYWQMGSFAMKTPKHLLVLLPIIIVITFVIIINANQLDILTLGDEQAKTSGVEVKRIKWILLLLSTIITGAIVSVAGIIGFVDLFTPHIGRKIFGASHKWVVPASALIGGTFMVICDLFARTIVAPLELPVGAITAVVGAPFFIYLYFGRRKND